MIDPTKKTFHHPHRHHHHRDNTDLIVNMGNPTTTVMILDLGPRPGPAGTFIVEPSLPT